MSKYGYTFNASIDEEVRIVQEKLPLEAHAVVREIYEALDSGNFAECRSLAEKILEAYPDVDLPELRTILATSLLNIPGDNNKQQAEYILRELYAERPDESAFAINAAAVCYRNQDYREVIRIMQKHCPLDEYLPHAYLIYGKSLRKINQDRKALAVFRLDLEEYELTGTIRDWFSLASVFQEILILDLQYDGEHFPADLGLLEKFIMQEPVSDESRQKIISDIVIMISKELNRKWIRPIFYDFLVFLDNNKILSGPYYISVYTGYTSVESYYIHEDHKISSFTEDFLVNAGKIELEKVAATLHGETLIIPGHIPEYYPPEEATAFLYDMNTALAYQWYMSRKIDDYREELLYASETYPHTWEGVKDSFQAMLDDPDALRASVLNSIIELQEVTFSSTISELSEELDRMADMAVAVVKEPVAISGIGTFRKGLKDIGRNDPCPCGSGKKYKKCCGKGIV